MHFICFMNIFYRYGKKLLEDMLSERGFTMQELIVILVINESESILQSKLINFTGLDKGNFSKFLKDLEKRNYIYRQESQEYPGQNLCYLSAEGKKVVPYFKAVLEKWEALISKDIEAEDLKNLYRTSSKISENIFDELDIRW